MTTKDTKTARAALSARGNRMMAKNTKIADEITELTQDEIAEVAGGLRNLYKAPGNPNPIIYGYPNGPFGY